MAEPWCRLWGRSHSSLNTYDAYTGDDDTDYDTDDDHDDTDDDTDDTDKA